MDKRIEVHKLKNNNPDYIIFGIGVSPKKFSEAAARWKSQQDDKDIPFVDVKVFKQYLDENRSLWQRIKQWIKKP